MGSFSLSLGRFCNFPSLLETEAAGCSPGPVPGVRAEGLWAAGGGCVGAALDPPGRAGQGWPGVGGLCVASPLPLLCRCCPAVRPERSRAAAAEGAGAPRVGGGRTRPAVPCPALPCPAGPRGLSPAFVTAQRACPAHGWQRLCSLSRPPGSEPRPASADAVLRAPARPVSCYSGLCAAIPCVDSSLLLIPFPCHNNTSYTFGSLLILVSCSDKPHEGCCCGGCNWAAIVPCLKRPARVIHMGRRES